MRCNVGQDSSPRQTTFLANIVPGEGGLVPLASWLDQALGEGS
jgi:hypothetical protein